MIWINCRAFTGLTMFGAVCDDCYETLHDLYLLSNRHKLFKNLNLPFCMQKSFVATLALMALFIFSRPAQAQNTPYRLVVDMVSADTSDHAALLRQIRNLWRELPGTPVQIVMHGQALTMVQSDKAVMADRITALQKEGVVFSVCRNTMRRYKLTEKDFIPAATFVPAAIAELVKKQQEGWSYIKAGH
jgi:uncharacterized protein